MEVEESVDSVPRQEVEEDSTDLDEKELASRSRLEVGGNEVIRDRGGPAERPPGVEVGGCEDEPFPSSDRVPLSLLDILLPLPNSSDRSNPERRLLQERDLDGSKEAGQGEEPETERSARCFSLPKEKPKLKTRMGMKVTKSRFLLRMTVDWGEKRR